ncbi:MAG: hypothetical protein EA351_07315 [Gemmatimonadales bacterium]|nr:MAG: hypothetical protein EA351_07315 [Gemmatimonadales bacterium]
MTDTTVADLDREAVLRIARSAGLEAAGRAEEGFFVSGPEAEIRALRQLIRSVLSEGERDEELIDVLLQDIEPTVMGPEHMLQLRMQAEARKAFLQEVALLDSAGVGELLGSKARNTSAMASRLKREGKLFAVTHRGVDLYPADQIVDGAPSPAIPEILGAFSSDSPWALALWLNAPSAWLEGEKPLRVLAADPDRVVHAARKSTEPNRF